MTTPSATVREQRDRLLKASRAFLNAIDDMTTDDFMTGKDRKPREALRTVITDVEAHR